MSLVFYRITKEDRLAGKNSSKGEKNLTLNLGRLHSTSPLSKQLVLVYSLIEIKLSAQMELGQIEQE